MSKVRSKTSGPNSRVFLPESSSCSISVTGKVPAGHSNWSCALAGEAKTPSVASATIASMTISISTSAIEYGLVVVVALLITAPLLLTDALPDIQYYRAQGAAHPPQGTIFAGTWTLLGVANFLERREGEVRRTPLPRTRMNRGNREGWVQGKPTSNSGKEKEPLGSKTHPTNTIARADELTVNSWRSSGQNAPTTH